MKKIKTISRRLLIGIGMLTVIGLTVNLIITNYVGKSIIKDITDGYINNVTNHIHSLLESSIDLSIKNYLRGIAEKDRDMVEYYYEQYLKKKLSYVQMKEKISEFLLAQKIGKTGYTYVINSNSVLVIHPKSSLIGTNVANYSIAKNQIEQKNGYLEYMWKNPDDSIERKKALYMTYFEPLDMIISVSSYRDEFIDLINIADLKSRILNMKLGKSGYPYVVNLAGKMIIHPVLENQNMLNQTDADGNFITQKIINKKNGIIYYNWKNPNDSKARSKIAILRYLEPLNWIIVASAYPDEFEGPMNYLSNSLIIISIFILMIMLIQVYWLSKKIGNPIKIMVEKAEMISKGDLSVDINIKTNDELEILADSINKIKNTIVSIVNEINVLSEKTINGQLQNRANPDKYSGDFKLLILGLNKTLDSIISPLMLTADNIDRISKGDIPDLLEVELSGDFNIIKDNLNQCILSINQVLTDSKGLFDSALKGNLGFRADIEKHKGEFKNIIYGVNSTLDRLVGLIDNMPIPVQIVDSNNKVIYSNNFKLK
jgi:HAMP domain-containing protein